MKMQGTISVIIPIYNAEKYVEKCIKSIVSQSYDNLDIILLNDGSTDTSREICLKWVECDSRIRFFEHDNMGQGPTEMRGITTAVGEYFCFVDADDWLDKDFVANMYDTILLEKADICSCCNYRYDDSKNVVLGVNENLKPLFRGVKDGYIWSMSHTWGRLYKRSLFLENDIVIPEFPHQDLATYPIVSLLAKKICYVDKALYYYRENTVSSVTNRLWKNFYYPQVFSHLFSELKKRELLDLNDSVWYELVFYHIKPKLLKAKRFNPEHYTKCLNKTYEIMDNYFVGWKEKYQHNYVAFGSYNISRIVNLLDLGYDILEENSNFFWKSSIISIMSSSYSSDFEYPNKLRNMMLKHELKKDFWESIEKNDNYLILDFLEERYDIIEAVDNQGKMPCYLTKSELYDEVEGLQGYRRISRYSMECLELWKESCDRFVTELKRYYKECHIILVEAYLNEYAIGYGEDKEKYDVIEMNKILCEYYRYFKTKIPEAIVIPVPKELCYTDYYFEYGRQPEYYNRRMFFEIAHEIRDRLYCYKR